MGGYFHQDWFEPDYPGVPKKNAQDVVHNFLTTVSKDAIVNVEVDIKKILKEVESDNNTKKALDILVLTIIEPMEIFQPTALG